MRGGVRKHPALVLHERTTMEQLIPIRLIRKFIEDGCGDPDYILWLLDKYEAGTYEEDDEDEDTM